MSLLNGESRQRGVHLLRFPLRGAVCMVLFVLGSGATAAQPSPAGVRALLLYESGRIPSFSTEGDPVAETAPNTAAFNASPDPWLAVDKVQHATVSFFWTLGSQYVFVNKLAVEEGPALPLSAASALAAGLAKEWYDARQGRPRRFSRRDLAADAVGIALAAGLIAL